MGPFCRVEEMHDPDAECVSHNDDFSHGEGTSVQEHFDCFVLFDG